jgi:PIN domain nuclease of toxin-antitoxin system
MEVLLDTHALVWWTLDPEKLSDKARKVCSGIVQDGAAISSISIWEVGIKIKNRSLDIGMSVEEYLEKLHELGCIELIPVDERIWIESLRLSWSHRDPADRVIVATAKSLGLPVVSRDAKIQDFYARTIW